MSKRFGKFLYPEIQSSELLYMLQFRKSNIVYRFVMLGGIRQSGRMKTCASTLLQNLSIEKHFIYNAI
jgi:hypothetical protein